MSNELTVALRIQAFVDQAKAAVKDFNSDINRLGQTGAQAGQSLNQVADQNTVNNLQNASQSVNDTSTEVDNLKDSVELLAGAWIAFQSLQGLTNVAREMFDISDQAVLLAARVRRVTQSEQERLEVQQALYEQAQRLQVPQQASLDLFTRINPVITKLNGTFRDTLTINEAVAASLRISGASTEESASTIQQFAQALASGVLAGDEFKSLAEAAPSLMQYIADAIGVPRGALKQMAADGKLTSSVVANAVIKASAAIKASTQALPQTVSGAITQLSNAYQHWTADNDNVNASARATASVIKEVADNFGTAANVIAGAAAASAAVLTSRAIGGITAYIVKVYETRVALIATTQAALAQAEAESVLAAAELRAAEATAANLGTTNALAAAQVRAAAATEALTVAKAASSAASVTAGGALRGLAGMLGGPVGIIATLGIAGAAWLAFGRDAKKGVETAREELDRLNKSEQSFTHGDEIKSKVAEIVSLGAQITDLQKKQEQSSNPEYIKVLGNEITELGDKQKTLAEIIAKLKNGSGALIEPAAVGQLTDDPSVMLDKVRKDFNTRVQIESDYHDNLLKVRNAFKIAIDKESDPTKRNALASEEAETIAGLNEKHVSALAGLSKAAFDRVKADAQQSKAQLDVNLTLLKDAISRGNVVIEQALKDGNISIDAAYQARLGNLQAQTDAQRKTLEAERAQLQQALGKAKNPQERAGIETNLLQLGAKLTLLQPSLDEATQQLQVWKASQERELATVTAKIRVDVAGLTGQFDRAAVEAQLRQQYLDDYQRVGTIADPAEQAAQRQRLNMIVQAGAAQAEFNAKLEEAQRIQQRLSTQEESINNQVKSGQLSQIEGDGRIKAAREAQLPALREIIGQLNKMRDAFPPDARLAIDNASASIEQLHNQVKAATPTIVDFGTQAKNKAIDGLADAAGQAVANFSNFGDAIRSTLKQIAGDIVSSSIKRLLVDQFTPTSSGGSSNAGTFVGAIASAFGFSKGGSLRAVKSFSGGGRISGPGTGTSDSVPAVIDGRTPIAVSDDEYIQPEKAVKHYGLGFMDAVRTLRFPKPRFAFGGLIQAHQAARFATGGATSAASAGAAGMPTLSIQFVNQGTPQRMVSQQQTMNGKDMVVSVVLNDLATGGPINNAMRGAMARGK